MGSLLQEINDNKIKMGALHKLRTQMTEEDFDDLFIALNDQSISIGAVYRALKKRNIDISSSTLQRLRNDLDENR